MLNVDVGGVRGEDGVEGWKTLDIYRTADFVHDLNSGNPFPFANGKVDNFYCSHTLEHVKPWMVQHVVNEFHRCLRRKGRVRIVVPDIGLAIKWYMRNPEALLHRNHPKRPSFYPEIPMGRLLSWLFTVRKGGGDGHYMGFDWPLLRHYLNTARFRTIDRMVYGECFRVFRRKDRLRYKDFSLFVEAKK